MGGNQSCLQENLNNEAKQEEPPNTVYIEKEVMDEKKGSSINGDIDESSSSMAVAGQIFSNMMDFRKNLTKLWSLAIEEDNGLYAHRDLPKITMETLSSTGFNVILLITYLSFSAAIIMYLVLDSGSHGTIQMNSGLCGSNSTKSTSNYGSAYSCSIDHMPYNQTSTFVGNISNLVNLIGDIELYVFIPASKVDNSTTYFIDMGLELKGCTSQQTEDCIFQDVLTLKKSFELKSYYKSDGTHMYRGILFDTFQNQEILQNNGIIEAYHINATYLNHFEIITQDNIAYYEFHYYSVYNPLLMKIMQCILCGFTMIYAIIWFSALFQDERNPFKWLRERKWLSWFLLGLMFFQNPIYCVAQWYVGYSKITGWTAYLSSLMTFAGQAIIFTVFLLLADGIASNNTLGFYFPKISFGLLIFLMYALMISIDFPSIFDPERSSILSVMNWPEDLQKRYAIIGSILLFLILYWMVYFLVATIQSGAKLRKIPYIKARQQHLVYRFFLLQAILVGAVFVLEYVVDFSNIFSTGRIVFRWEKIADYLNSLFNSENESISWLLFISVYVYLILYLHLPVDRANMHYFLSRSYVLREAEMFAAKQIRHQDLMQLRRFGLYIPKFVEKKPIFCIETARWMMELSYQAYYDPPQKPQVSGSLGKIDVQQFGFEILDFVWDEEHDTNCFILRHKAKKKLVVLFRGSMSREHWADNLKLHLQAIDVHTMCPRGLEDSQPSILEDDLREYMEDLEEGPAKPLLGRMREGVQNLPRNFFRAGKTGVEFVRDELEVAAEITRLNRIPGLKHALIGYVHTGFWEAYSCVREQIHRTVRQYLMEDDYQLFLTGHSLGGALASLAALDLMVHTIPKVNAVWASRRGLESDAEFEGMCTLTMYNFGSPRVGNHPFRTTYNRLVPHSFRVVVDGDAVTGLPPRFWYQHLGTEVIIDGEGGGNLIIDPSVAEKKFQIRSRSNIQHHALKHYRDGLCSILGEEIDKEILEDLLKPPPPDEILPEIVPPPPGFFGRMGLGIGRATSAVGTFFRVGRKTQVSTASVNEIQLDDDQPLAQKLL